MNAQEMMERVERCGGHAAESLQRARILPGFGETFTRDAAAFNAAAGWYGEQLGLATLLPGGRKDLNTKNAKNAKNAERAAA